ncbi:mannose-1-phosphate guanylyltransferase/mannose-6-phosphate isomerase [Thioalkalivibrio sp. XN8]|uniref:mannose-1-phosphate guanylyltransferase/mannose-6-phosphate isomerase n=1 Tax=Thioalkalivibrio sp. XN8 TaxID=2712863 RepID=UPI0013EBACD9|nr:mannose-1-phosphate guanylyltransferase/mannose-6-phosphate isomerase [Thioalkalivibrio sp. XN8]NGP53767.1 mannose-1-phosphate guanylyltransferase/mannose-6-phosphate isomerase [Thioalkalivibrio sp. XN8]
MIVPVILSGGSGTRLWPLSRELYPKQLLPLVGEQTMLQATLARLDGIEGLAEPIIVCNEEHRFLVAEQLRAAGVKPAAILLEPVGRNTAPAVALAAATALQEQAQGVDPVLLVLPADHVIRDPATFRRAVAAGAKLAEEGKLVTFGVVPDRPETGYGYIRAAAKDGAAAVQQFVEKPDAKLAAEYVASGEYFWNSGMFMFRAGRYIEELRTHRPEIVTQCVAAVAGAKSDLDFVRVDRHAFEECPSDSIDYAVMENTAHAWMVPLAAGWSDVGSWASLHDACEADAAGNVAVGDVLCEDATNCYLYAQSRLVAAVGLADCVVVETKDAVLVAPRDRVQDVKKLVARLKADGRYETSLHRQVFRPWGSYDSIDNGDRFQVKRIVVNPGAQLSLQMHHHRAEHWIVVQGTARVTCGDEVFLLGENQSTYIPMGTTHRLENPGKVPLHLVEVQSGSYLGEDDIVRFEDTYGRG